MAQSGSARVNYVGGSTNEKFVITYNENLAENEAFFYFSNIFSELNANTPKIFAISEDRTCYIQEFLGSETLSEIIAKEGLSENVKFLVKKAITKLYQLQKSTTEKIDYSKTLEYKNYDELPILNDLFYFKNFFLDVLEISYHKASLILEFKKLISEIDHLQPKGLMIRDFQARNIMVNTEDEVFFIDYQAAMFGPLMYDVVSFLYQAKANFPESFKAEMLEFYYSLWNDEKSAEKLKNSLEYLKLIRFLQVLGAYGFRGMVQKKPHFLASIEKGMENLQNFAKNWEEMKNYPEMMQAILNLKKYNYKNIE